jgi:hypothetical protein
LRDTHPCSFNKGLQENWMTDIDLRPDCSRCDALCCVLLAFDASPAFAFDKPACAPCRNLAPDNRCTIHAKLADLGFGGCSIYDCQGAGQRVTGQVFKGRSWRNDPTLLPEMEMAFRTMRRLHDAVALLNAAGRLPLPAEAEQTRRDLLTRLDASRNWTPNDLRALETGPELRAVAPFLASLRGIPGLTPPRR